MDLISASMEWSMASIGGFCVGSHFIVEHQRLSGLGYCFSASLPPLLAQAAISALNRYEQEPEMFIELQETCKRLHHRFQQLSSLTLSGDVLSPVKHLYLKDTDSQDHLDDEQRRLTLIADKVKFSVCFEKFFFSINFFPVDFSVYFQGCGCN